MKKLTVKLAVILFILLLVSIAFSCTAPAPETVVFPDKNLEEAIRTALDKPAGEAITPAEMARLTVLPARELRITDLSGIEYCTNLSELDLDMNRISDISPLASLTSLTRLQLSYNQIDDISPLSSLTSLEMLRIWGNQISDISPLASLTNLDNLVLSENQISDISPLAFLTNLTFLRIRFNQISDISPLASLTNLAALNLHNNQISDISPLVENSGLNEEDSIVLTNNNLDLSEGSEDLENIRILEERGVDVEY
jgi:Leucine-rich repeat (LRR) protein